jgi:hypothetical protein
MGSVPFMSFAVCQQPPVMKFYREQPAIQQTLTTNLDGFRDVEAVPVDSSHDLEYDVITLAMAPLLHDS